QLVSIDFNGTTRIWDWATAKELRSFASPSANDGSAVGPLLGGKGGFGGGVAIGPGRALSAEGQNGVIHSADGNALMFLARTNTLRFIDVRTGKEIGPSGHST